MLRFITMSEPAKHTHDNTQNSEYSRCILFQLWLAAQKCFSSSGGSWGLPQVLLLYTVTSPRRCNFTHQPSTHRWLFFACSAILWPVLCSLIVHHCFYCWVPSTSKSILYGRKFTSHLCQIKSKPLTSHKGGHPFRSIEQKFIALLSIRNHFDSVGLISTGPCQ